MNATQTYFRLLALIGTIAGINTLSPSLAAEEPLSFTFAGPVSIVAPELSAMIETETFIFSGSLEFSDRTVHSVASSGDDFAIYNSCFVAAEFTLDQHYILKEAGVLTKGDDQVEVFDHKPDSEDIDYVKLRIPVDSTESQAGPYRASWIELLFYDDSGEMLDSLEVPKRELSFSHAEFRITYFNPETQLQVMVAGPLDYYARETTEISIADDRKALEAAILDLDGIIRTQNATIERLNGELSGARATIAELEAKQEELQAQQKALLDGSLAETLQAEITDLSTTIDSLQAKEQQAQIEIKQLADERAELREKSKTLLLSLDFSNKKLTTTEGALNQQQATVASLRQQLQQQEAAFDNLQSELELLQQAALAEPSEFMEVTDPIPGGPQATDSDIKNTGAAASVSSESAESFSNSRRYGPKRR